MTHGTDTSSNELGRQRFLPRASEGQEALVARLGADHEHLLGAFAQVRRLARLQDYAATQRKLFQLRAAVAQYFGLEDKARQSGLLTQTRAVLDPLRHGVGDFLRRFSEGGVDARSIAAFARELGPIEMALQLHLEQVRQRLQPGRYQS